MGNKFKLKGWRVAAAILTLGAASVAFGEIGQIGGASGTEPAQEPLANKVQIPAPNIMLSVDTSGSMGSMVIPDTMGEAIWGTNVNTSMYQATLHPDDKGLTGQGFNRTTITYVLSSELNNIAAAIGRSPQLNKIYYNPAVRYRPWRTADGGYMKEYPAAAAPMYATDPSRGVVNLELVDKLTTFPTSGSSGNYARHCRTLTGSCTTGAFRITPALYFIYKGPDRLNSGFGYTATNTDIRNIANYDAYAIAASSNSAGFNISQIYRNAGYQVSDPDAAGYIAINRLPLDGEAPNGCTQDGSGDIICTQAAELQNFSNWYVYYRGRMRTAIAAITETFAKDFGMEYRLGWATYAGTFSVDGLGSFFGIRQGVRTYDEANGNHPTKFYNFLNALEYNSTNNSTPTPEALQGIGNYFSNGNAKGPWGENPGDGGGKQISCRKSYAIMFTDGGWNQAVNSTDIDGKNGPTITDGAGRSYQYVPAAPYKDNFGGTLADMAMFYWNRDLRSDLANNVPTSTNDPAFWQHLVTHTVGFGVTGTLDPETTDLSTVVWPNPGSSGDSSNPRRIDDLWHTAVNGHGTFSSASDITKLVTSLRSILESMAAANLLTPYRASATDYLGTSNSVYAPSYMTGVWSGELTGHKMTSTAGAGTPIWEASKVMPAHSARNIWVGAKDANVNLTFIEFKGAQTAVNAALTADMVEYLRGDNTNVATLGYRQRANNGKHLLGDIINSNPVYVGKGNSAGYGSLPSVLTVGGKPVSTNKEMYRAYYQWKDSRDPKVFVGANDGMLHAFNATTGVEEFAYIPSAVTGKLADLAAPTYEGNHRYYVDGPLQLVDAAIGSSGCVGASFDCWRNVLLGSTGAGAKSVFALDVTDPTKYATTPAGTDIGNVVLWEITPESGTGDSSMANLGYVMQPVQAGLAKNGQWVGVFANGAHSTAGHASLFIVDLKTGDLIKEIVVDSGSGNGLMGVTLIRNDKKVIIGAYAGDLKGNIWRFDLNDDNSNQWKSQYTNAVSGKPVALYTGNRPISQAPVFAKFDYNDESKGYMVLFGTGKYYDMDDKYDTSTEALYGIWDKGSVVPASDGILLERQLEEVTVNGKTYYDLIDADKTKTVNWTTQRGWRIPIKLELGQRSIYSPTISGNNALFSTIFPGSGAASEDCVVKSMKSGLIVLDLYSGGYSTIKWDTNGDGLINSSDRNLMGGPVDAQGPGTIFTNPRMDAADLEGNVVCEDGTVYGGLDVAGVAICQEAQDNTSWAQLF